MKKDDLNRAFQEWKALSESAQSSYKGKELLAALRKRFVSTSAACEAACDLGCAQAYAEALREISTNTEDRDVLAANKRIKTIEANLQKVEAIGKEAERNIASAANKLVTLKNSTFPKACVTATLEEKIGTRLFAACEKCRVLANPRSCAITLLEAGGGLQEGASTAVCKAIIDETEAALNDRISSTPPLIPAPANNNAATNAVGAAIDAAVRAATEATRAAGREAQKSPPPPATSAPRAPSPSSTPTPAPIPGASTSASTRVIHKEQPAFPADAMRRGISSGSVRARMSINAQGLVTDIEILNSTPARVFDRAVRDALSNWRFNVGADGRRHEVEINFNAAQ